MEEVKLYSKTSWNKKDPSIHVVRAVSDRESPIHTHDFIEIVYTREGSAVHYVNGVQYELRRGDLLFINYGATHSFKPIDSVTYINVAFYPETMGEHISPQNAFSILTLTAFQEILSEEHGVITFLGSARTEIEEMLDALLRESEGGQILRNMAMSAYMELLILKIIRKVSGEIDGDDLWPDISRYIEENLDQDLSLAALSKKCFYNPSYFSRIFKERYSLPLSEYVMKKRIEKAKELLLTTDYAINKISLMVGFNNKSFFYKMFFKFYGTTPLQCRKTLGKSIQFDGAVLEEGKND